MDGRMGPLDMRYTAYLQKALQKHHLQEPSVMWLLFESTWNHFPSDAPPLNWGSSSIVKATTLTPKKSIWPTNQKPRRKFEIRALIKETQTQCIQEEMCSVSTHKEYTRHSQFTMPHFRLRKKQGRVEVKRQRENSVYLSILWNSLQQF